jgi:hypothetical protein
MPRMALPNPTFERRLKLLTVSGKVKLDACSSSTAASTCQARDRPPIEIVIATWHSTHTCETVHLRCCILQEVQVRRAAALQVACH